MDPKFKNRFFEPLVLLETLNQTQGDRILEEIDQITERSSESAILSRREFMRQLCRACDYKKGGETVTSLVLETTPQGPVYWISVREPTVGKVKKFLRELLDTLGDPINISSTTPSALQEQLLSRLVSFATPRIRDHRRLLRTELESASVVLNTKSSTVGDREGIQVWIDYLLQAIEDCQLQPLKLCQLLYDQLVTGKGQRQLKYLEAQQPVRGEPNGRWVRHYMGRLASVVHSSHVLSNASKTHQYLFEDYDIKVVHCGQQQPGPALKKELKFDGLVRRMQSCEIKDSPGLVEELHRLDQRFGLASRMRDKFDMQDFKLRVHSELALLEAVHAAGVEFYDDDRYIACSKGACFCCYLYICQHPGNFVHPASHNNIWLKWAPPDLPSGPSAPYALSFKQQRELLMRVNNDVRRRAVEAVRSKTGLNNWHPDSTTGMGSAKNIIQVSVTDDVMTRSSSVDSVKGSLDPEALSERSQSPLLFNEESDHEYGGVALEQVSAQIAALGIH